MAVVVQRDEVRVIAFNKCGHTSIINMFMTPPEVPLKRGSGATPFGAPAVRNSTDEAKAQNAFRGDEKQSQDWPAPKVTIAFLREPIKRALSCYQHFFVRSMRQVEGVRNVGRPVFVDMGFKIDMSFPEFCFHLGKVDLDFDAHLRPQATSLYEAASPPMLTFKLEHLNTIWPNLVKAFNLNSHSDHLKLNAADYDRQRHFKGEHVDFINHLYRLDLQYWLSASESLEAGTSLSTVYNQASA